MVSVEYTDGATQTGASIELPLENIRVQESSVTDHNIDIHILPTKLNRPVTDSRWIVRPRLLSALDGALGKKLTLISAPAGYGNAERRILVNRV